MADFLTDDIESLIPHRTPFKFVDKIISADNEKVVAEHTFTDQEFFFKGHFPEYPVVPGVILVETMAQAGGAGMAYQKIFPEGALFFLATVDKVKFRRQVRPNETVRIEVENLKVTPHVIKQAGKAYVGDEICCQAEWMCLVGNEWKSSEK